MFGSFYPDMAWPTDRDMRSAVAVLAHSGHEGVRLNLWRERGNNPQRIKSFLVSRKWRRPVAVNAQPAATLAVRGRGECADAKNLGKRRNLGFPQPDHVVTSLRLSDDRRSACETVSMRLD